MKRITCILLTCILCFSISGCTKTYKGTDELIEKAREEIPVSDADTIDMQYGGMCTVDDTALVWFISGNQYCSINNKQLTNRMIVAHYIIYRYRFYVCPKARHFS